MRVVVPSRYDDLCDGFLGSMENSQPGSTAAVIVADNGLSPELKARWTRVQFVSVEASPFCYAKAINTCVELAHPEDTLILGDDMIMQTPRWLDIAARFLHRWPLSYGALNLLQNSQHQEAEVVESPVALGLGVTFIPRHIWDAFGPWDERYDGGYGYEDWDYNMRLWHKGFLVGWTNVLRVAHAGSATWRRKLGSYEAVIGRCMSSHQLFYAKWGLPVPRDVELITGAPHLKGTCACQK